MLDRYYSLHSLCSCCYFIFATPETTKDWVYPPMAEAVCSNECLDNPVLTTFRTLLFLHKKCDFLPSKKQSN